MPADPKPAKRIKDSKVGIEKVRKEGRCRVCGRVPSGHQLDSLNRAHLIPKGQGGDDIEYNIVPLCGSGTTGCHGALTAHTPGWEQVASDLRVNLEPEELNYIIEKKGWDWLERVYPLHLRRV